MPMNNEALEKHPVFVIPLSAPQDLATADSGESGDDGGADEASILARPKTHREELGEPEIAE